MIYIREFEIYENDGFFIAEPLDMEGGTFGESFEDAVKSASNWLRETALDSMAHGRLMQGGRLNGTPSHGGRVVVVSVDCDLSRTDAVTAADAARMLGVSSRSRGPDVRIGEADLLERRKQRMVLRQSSTRLAENPKPGRPKRPKAIEG
ncbi:MAG: hypothetical protein ACLT98_17540 [Eggerthellaceae bacterium]